MGLLRRSRDGEAAAGRSAAEDGAQEEDGRESERPWLANHILVKIIDKKLRGGRWCPHPVPHLSAVKCMLVPWQLACKTAAAVVFRVS